MDINPMQGLKTIFAALALAMTVVLPGCSNETSIFAEAEKNEWEGSLNFVFIGGLAVPFFLTGSEALLLRPSKETEFIGISPLKEGEGINIANHLFHSASTFRMKGEISEEKPVGLQLLSIPTKFLDVKSIELIKQGERECVGHIASPLPLRGLARGWGVLPDYAKGKKGLFIYDGKARCTIVPVGGKLTHSVEFEISNFSEEAEWARPAKVGK